MTFDIVQIKLRITPAPSNLTKSAQKTLCTKTPLRRGVTGKTFPDTEKNNKRDASVKHTLGCLWYVLQKIRRH